MTKMPLTVWPSQANFILFRPNVPMVNPASATSGSSNSGLSTSGGGAGRALWQALLDQSVLVRDCSSWDGLTDCLRVTVGTPAENDRFLAALQTALLARD
jgi:histidinol-phosphate aminotransferase